MLQSRNENKKQQSIASVVQQKKNQKNSFADNRAETAQLKSLQNIAQEGTTQLQENNTGLPDNLKSGIEHLSGYSMDDVNVHYNSDRPAQLQAHAYAQGTDIHISPGQEKHLPHEAWHVVQQKQGRVQPTTQLKGKVAINDDTGLEKEADIMGAKALNTSLNTQTIPSPTANINTNAIQRAPVDGMIAKETRLKQNEKTNNVDAPMERKIFGSSYIGNTLKPGETIPNVDFDLKKDGYYKTTLNNQIAWLEIGASFNKALLAEENVGFEQVSYKDEFSDRIGDTGDLIDGIAGGLENTWLKGTNGKGGINTDLTKGSGESEGGSNGKFGDLKNINKGIETAKNSSDFTSGSLGALSSLWGMKNAAKDFYQEPSWKAFGEGVESLTGGVSNGAKAVDGMAKALGNKDGTGDSDIVGKYSGAVNDGVSSVKNAFVGFMGLWNLYNSPSNTKEKDALVSSHQITKAALGAANVAKSAYDIIGKGIPTSLLTTIPGLSIAVSAINLIIRFADAWQSGDLKNDMAKKSDLLRPQVLGTLSQEGKDQETKPQVFRDDQRGIWPSYVIYQRILPEIIPAIDKAYNDGQNANDKISDANTHEGKLVKKSQEEFEKIVQTYKDSSNKSRKNKTEARQLEIAAFELLKNNNGLVTDQFTALHQQWKKALEKQDTLEKETKSAEDKKNNSASENNSLPDKIIQDATHKSIQDSNIGNKIKGPLKAKVRDKSSLESLKLVTSKIQEYELTDKMAEINQKRKVSGYSDVAKEMINITADVINLSGVGAIVGASMKGIVAAESLAHSGAKGIQHHYRDNKTYQPDEINKSSSKKHSEYVGHTQQIFKMLSTASDKNEAINILSVLKATGVNTGMMFALNGEPAKQAEMIVEAMKKRN